MGECLFIDKSNNLMHIIFLPLLTNFEIMGHYSWGSVGLAWSYRELYRASRLDAHDIVEPFIGQLLHGIGFPLLLFID